MLTNTQARAGGRDCYPRPTGDGTLCQSQQKAPPPKLRLNSDPDAATTLCNFLSSTSATFHYMGSLQKGQLDANTSSAPSTLYIPIASPPTPAPSPGPFTIHAGLNHLLVNTTNLPLVNNFQQFAYDPTHDFSSLSEQARLEYLNKIIAQCTLRELSHLSALINPRLKRDFLRELPTELALHILSYVDCVYQLVRNVAGVCKHWRRLSNEDCLWRRMCQRWEFAVPSHLQSCGAAVVPGTAKRHFKVLYLQREFTNPTSPFLTCPILITITVHISRQG
jgi:hypothetical protein